MVAFLRTKHFSCMVSTAPRLFLVQGSTTIIKVEHDGTAKNLPMAEDFHRRNLVAAGFHSRNLTKADRQPFHDYIVSNLDQISEGMRYENQPPGFNNPNYRLANCAEGVFEIAKARGYISHFVVDALSWVTK